MRLQSFRISLRFILPLILILSAFAYGVVPLIDNLTLRWFTKDLDMRSQLVANSLQEPLAEYVPRKLKGKIDDLFTHEIQDERLYALAFCDSSGNLLYKTQTFPTSLGCRIPDSSQKSHQSLVSLPQGSVHVAKWPINGAQQQLGSLILVHDMSFIERRSADTKIYVISLFALLAVVISIITVFIAHLSWRGWINGMREFLRGDFLQSASLQRTPPEMKPLVGDIRQLLKALHSEHQEQTNLPQGWNAERLRSLLHNELAGDEVIVVSNREPYIHVASPGGIEVQRPASGLVTAVEAVMRACSGTWIAHGSGSADREAADRHGRVQVPPSSPAYSLRRVWLSKAEEQGYYYGFSNEGLWPLCHIAHVRPVFRSSDWEQYVAVNRRFADTVVEEARTDDPVVLVQDYHLALVPQMVREALPDATIITFWHIPWPNSESFGICPWRKEILEGLLGSTILGFHTPFHCKNFLETVDRYLEARIEQEASTVTYNGKLTQVEDYPISIAWSEATVQSPSALHAARIALRRELGLDDDQLLGIGVDRLDYTKGIVERLQAVERMLELYPALVGRFTFVQIAAPTRSSLEEYQAFEARVRGLVARINRRFSSGGYQPIILKAEHHDHEALQQYYRAADVCMVTSLHDGMNLVAKEFVAARDDEQGVLLLSQFTGAAREMLEALIVNPYHVEQVADALYCALTMPAGEQRERMRSMRMLVSSFNVYRWAGRMLLDAARLRHRQRVMSKIRTHSRDTQLRRVV